MIKNNIKFYKGGVVIMGSIVELYGPDRPSESQDYRKNNDYENNRLFIQSRVLSSFTTNAYRVLGLPIDASEVDVENKVNLLKRKLTLGIEEEITFGNELLENITLNNKVLVAAANRLQDPQIRSSERLYWFKSFNSRPIKFLTDRYRTLNDYLSIFYKVARVSDSIPILQLYELSILGLIYLSIDDYYVECITAWVDVYNVVLFILNHEEFWQQLQAIENKGKFSRTIYHSAENLKSDAIKNILQPLVTLSNKHLANRVTSGTNILYIMNKLSLAADIKKSIFDNIIDQIEDDLKCLCEKIIHDCSKNIVRGENLLESDIESNQELCDNALYLFKSNIEPLYKIHNYHTKNSTRNKRLSEIIAKFYYSLAINYTWADDYVATEELLLEAKMIIGESSILYRDIEESLHRFSVSVAHQKIYNPKKSTRERLSFMHNMGAKSCPFCASRIPMDATFCLCCGREIKTTFKSIPKPTHDGEYKRDSDLLFNTKSEETKTCPFCFFSVRKDAERCTFCNMELKTTIKDNTRHNNIYMQHEQEDDIYKHSVNNKNDTAKVALYVGIVVFVILIMIGFFVNYVLVEPGSTQNTANSYQDSVASLNYRGGQYYGNIRNGIPHGKGTLTWTDGRKYDGMFKAGSFHGSGTYTWPNGDKFIGEWENDDAKGYGYCLFNNGDRLEGVWSNTQSCTSATYIYSNGVIEKGKVTNGEFIPW
jgi:hypothetical protein